MSRTPKDYAIEHAEYMAKAAETFLSSVSTEEMAREALNYEDDDTCSALDAAVDSANQHRRGLVESIYEFRKRRDRALSEQPAAPSGEAVAWVSPQTLEWLADHKRGTAASIETRLHKTGGGANPTVPLYAHPPEGTHARDALNQIVDFLCGSGTLEGCWFGEKPPTERGNFWWRPHLRAAIKAIDDAGRSA